MKKYTSVHQWNYSGVLVNLQWCIGSQFTGVLLECFETCNTGVLQRCTGVTLQCITGVSLHWCNTGVSLQRCITGVSLQRCFTGVSLQRCIIGVSLQRCITGVSLHRCTTGVSLHLCLNTELGYSSITCLKTLQYTAVNIHRCITSVNLHALFCDTRERTLPQYSVHSCELTPVICLHRCKLTRVITAVSLHQCNTVPGVCTYSFRPRWNELTPVCHKAVRVNSLL